MALQPRKKPVSDWDIRAHALVSNVLDSAEKRLMRQHRMMGPAAHSHLCMEYIKTSADFIRGSVQFIESDEIKAAGIFIWRNTTETQQEAMRLQSDRCAHQLALNAAWYFPDYHATLQKVALFALARMTDITQLEHSGLHMLAAATLPGYAVDLRREIRRRGGVHERTIVQDDLLARRLSRSAAMLALG